MKEIPFKLKYAITGSILVPCFGRIALHGTGVEYDFYRYLIPFFVGSIAGFIIGYMKDRGETFNDHIKAKNIRLEKEIEDRIKLEKKLRLSEDRLIQAQNLAHIGHWRWDINANTLSWSDETYRIFGRNPETFDVTVDTFESAIHPDDYDSFAAERDLAIRENREFNIEHRIVLPDKHIRFVQELASVNRNDKDQIVNMTGIVQDVTPRKKAETDLFESEKRFRTLFTEAPDAIFIIDMNDHLLETNIAATKMLGYTRDEFKRMTVADLQAQKVRGEVGSIARNELSHGKVFEGLDLHKNGTVIPVEIHNHKMALRGHDIVLSIVRDVTDRKTAEQALKKSEEELKSIFRVAPSGIGVVADRILLQVNNRVCQMTGYSKEELLGQSARILYPSQADFEYVGRNKYKQMNQYGIGTVETRWRKKSGELIHVLMSSTPIDKKNHGKGITFTALDITELKLIEKDKLKLEQQLRRAQKMEAIGTLAGGIAHDFNNILFPIMGNAELMLEDIPEGNPLRNNVDAIYSAVIRAKDLVRQILTFSRQEKNELRLIKIQPILNEALKMMRSTIPTTIEINSHIDKKCGAIKADPTQIHQVIINLITNAFHAMETHGGVLDVSLKAVEIKKSDLPKTNMTPGTYICLIVADTGKGIDKSVKEKIFDPYFTTKEKGKGTGMGLSVVHGIISAMGGAVHVRSEPGKGAKFSVYCPFDSQAVFQNGRVSEKNRIQGGIERILLIDDEIEIIKMEKQVLERLGYQVTSHADSTKALEAFRASPDMFDMVVTDLTMPKLPGDKLAMAVSDIRPEIPIILNTGFSDKITLDSAKQLGIKAILMKPIVMKDLAATIRKVLDRAPE